MLFRSRTFKDKRIRYYKNEKNIERSLSRNKGIELSNGQYICFLDSDDAYRPNHLRVLYDYIKKQNTALGFIYTGIQMNFANGEIKQVCEIPLETDNRIEWLLEKQFPPPSSTCIAKQLLIKNNFNPFFKINEDIELWVRIAISNALFCIDSITVDFYIHGGNTKFVNNNPSREILKVFKEICKNPECKKFISKSYKQKRVKVLRSQIVTSNIESKNNIQSILYIFAFLIRYPFTYQNKYRLYVLLKNIPVMRNIVQYYSKHKEL